MNLLQNKSLHSKAVTRKPRFRFVMAALMVFLALIQAPMAATPDNQLPDPASFFGFQPGEARRMFTYEPLIEYLRLLEQSSDRIRLEQIGNSSEGRPIYIAFISSSENLSRLDQLRDINRSLALDTDLPNSERQRLIREGRVFVMATLSMHSNEVGPSQAAPLMAWRLISGKEPELTALLDEVVFMMNPSHNPDGMNMVVEHYLQYLDTPWEGSNLPGLYHKYVGHNINRDFITLTQLENQAIADTYNTEWYPHVLVEKHQMGSGGVRYFVPPNHDPIAQILDETLWTWSWVFGSNMTRDMTARGLRGISQHYLFDDYWPGSTQTSAWKNVISLLTEAASAQLATPIYIEPNELRVSGKGLSEYKKSINFLDPWPGGWWTLADIVEYELESMFSMLRTASVHKNEILAFRNDLARKEMQKGLSQAPYYFGIPAAQHDPGELQALLLLLQRHGVDLYQLKQDILLGDRFFRQGDYIIPLAQAYRPFILEMFSAQEFPVRRYTPGGDIIQPYDITSWSLPLHRGIESHAINQMYPGLSAMVQRLDLSDGAGQAFTTSPGKNSMLVFDARHNHSYAVAFRAMAAGMTVKRNMDDLLLDNSYFIPAGSFLIHYGQNPPIDYSSLSSDIFPEPQILSVSPAHAEIAELPVLRLPRILLCETNFHDMDAGWTRYLFDQYGIPYESLTPDIIGQKDLSANYDVIIFPDMGKDQIISGQFRRGGETVIPFYKPDYIKGLGREGFQKILQYLENGGRIVAWGRSVELFTGLMEPGNEIAPYNLPVSNVSQSLSSRGLSIPGSFLQVEWLEDHPLTLGMPNKSGVFQRSNPILNTSVPAFDMDRRVIGRFRQDNMLLSGYAENISLLSQMPALVWLKKGRGQLVLFSFVPNFRGSTPVSNKLIFNALLLDQSEEEPQRVRRDRRR